MQDTTINNLNLTMQDISKFPDLPVSSSHDSVEALGTIYTTNNVTVEEGTIYTLSIYKGEVYKCKGEWSDVRNSSFRYGAISWIEIAFPTVDDFQKIVKALNTLDACLKDIKEFAEKILREKLNTNQRPPSPK